MTKTHPILGVGYGTYPAEYPAYRRKVIVTDQTFQYMGAHSEPLRVLAETGVAGILISLWLLGAAFVLGIRVYSRRGKPRESALALALLSGLATYLIHSAFNSYTAVDKVTIPFWASIGVLAGLARREEPPLES